LKQFVTYFSSLFTALIILFLISSDNTEM